MVTVIMHPRNPYQAPLDFESLAKSYAPLSVHLLRSQNSNGRPVIDFKSVEAQRRLTEALLHRDFGIKFSVPNGRLCPAIPNRLNYVLWIQDLMNATFRPEDPSSSSVEQPLDRRIIGIDIGSGASAIYPLLASRLEPSWEFVGTEIDELSLRSAQANVSQNGLSARIRLMQTSGDGRVLAPLFEDESSNTVYAFTMCNPPFYSSAEDVERSAEGKAFEPNGVCTGSDKEMITDGGEVAFVRRMVDESAEVPMRCRWFTSMLGKLSSVAEVVAALRHHQVDNYAVTELVQGQTRRWAVGWSFYPIRLPDAMARAAPAPALRAVLPLQNELRQAFAFADASAGGVREVVEGVLGAMEGVSCVEEEREGEGEGEGGRWALSVCAAHNSWSRAERRRGLRERVGSEPHSGSERQSRERGGGHALRCTIRKLPANEIGNKQRKRESGDDVDRETRTVVLECAWREGHTGGRELFESFWSHVCRKVRVGAQAAITGMINKT